MKFNTETKLDILCGVIFAVVFFASQHFVDSVDDRCEKEHRVNPNPVTICE